MFPLSLSRWLLLAVAGLGLIALGRYGAGLMPTVLAMLEHLGPWAPFAFVGVYAVATVLIMPCFLLTLASGALFGLGGGVWWTFVGSVFGATGSFLAARYVLRDVLTARAAQDARFVNIDRAIAINGRWIAFLVRLSPAFPFVLVNYGLGLTRVSMVDYLLGLIGLLPVTLLYVYYGTVAGEVAVLARDGFAPSEVMGSTYYLLLVVGLVLTVVVSAVVARMATRALQVAVDSDS